MKDIIDLIKQIVALLGMILAIYCTVKFATTRDLFHGVFAIILYQGIQLRDIAIIDNMLEALKKEKQ